MMTYFNCTDNDYTNYESPSTLTHHAGDDDSLATILSRYGRNEYDKHYSIAHAISDFPVIHYAQSCYCTHEYHTARNLAYSTHQNAQESLAQLLNFLPSVVSIAWNGSAGDNFRRIINELVLELSDTKQKTQQRMESL